MNVLIISKYFLPYRGGVETFVGNLANVLCKEHEVSIFTFRHNYFLEGNEQYEKFNLKRVKPIFIYKGQPISMPLWQLYKEVRGADIVIYNYPNPLLELNLIIVLSILRRNLILIFHANIENSRWKKFNFIFGKIGQSLLRKSDYVVVSTFELVRQSRLNFKDITVLEIPIGVSLPTGHAKLSVLGRGKFRVLFLGALRAYKGVDVLIKAAKFDVEGRFEFIIVGDGEERTRLESLVKDLSLSEKVFFSGIVDDVTRDGIYKDSDVFVLPSINEAEAYGIVQVEAMAYGLPIINTKLKSGVPFVTTSDCAITVSPSNELELYKALLHITSTSEVYSRFSSKAKERSQHFCLDKVNEIWLNLLRDFPNE